ncbi:MAG: hypothetical protein XXXJIFNMEKO3_02601 [Candidatus Erwinia impunctatus]|nr:hypothetical protein XXXJIFNMEKO_02601 [Culicoides impunctatus]
MSAKHSGKFFWVEMMIKNKLLTPICLSLLLLQGCSVMKKNDGIIVKSQASQLPALQQCLQDTSTLVKLDNKYQKDASELYRLMEDAKYYASIATKSSESVSSTVAPLFEYKINDKCNVISQQLINEFKVRVSRLDVEGGNVK